MRTDVTITIDTEFNIAGAFEDFGRYKPVAEDAVYCAVEGRSQGLGYILDVFHHYGISATFFTEAVNTCYFGPQRMGDVARRIDAAGQDVQLHLHPCWTAFARGRLPDDTRHARNDDCAGRSPEDLGRIMEIGLEAFSVWGLPRPVALRTGSFSTDLNVYRVMADFGLPLASNVCMAVENSSISELQVTGGRHFIEGILEVPVLSFQDMPRVRPAHLRPLQVTACSWAEIEAVLWSARAARAENVVVLTHPFEYIKKKDISFSRMISNRVNQRRLARLCAFLRDNQRDFRTVSFAAAKDDWLARGEADAPQLTTALGSTVARMAENKINDLIWSY